jgi:benzylsuccinate CoA-transferase BbsF subunit
MGGALEGVKVLDMTWVVVGPSAVRVLADYGATVVKVETSVHVDTARTAGPHLNGKPGAESSACFNNGNAGKLGITLNAAAPAGKELLLKLVKWADVLAENFTPRVMRKWGLSWETLREVNPGLVYLSASMAGGYGPHSHMAAIGNIGGGRAGFTRVVGWPDRRPTGPGGAYTDYVAAKYITISLLAALEYRERTGIGQHIDLAQFETGIHFLAPIHLDYEVNGNNFATPRGNRSSEAVPHGVFPCAGHDRWVGIVARDTNEWLALCAAMSRPDLAAEDALRSVLGRREREDEIEEAIATWTAALEASDIEKALAPRGVPVYAALDTYDALRDEQLAATGHFVRVPHAAHGEVVVENTRTRMSRTPPIVKAAAPTYGEHSDRVLREILGLDDAEITELAAAGVLE